MSAHAQIMAIVNVSPDSFSGDGIAIDNETALRQKIQQAIADGADILDIGGQSTRPGAEILTIEEEIRRTVPAIRIAREIDNAIPISVDTFKPAVAEVALAAGATILNDVTGFEDNAMIALAAKTGCEVVVMHMRGTPKTMSQLTDYPGGVVNDVCTFFKERTAELVKAGIVREKIIIDPGIGFAKTAEQSFELTRNFDTIAALGFRVLYGASNKSFIGKALSHGDTVAPVEERAVGTVVVQAAALMKGAAVIRVHDVKAAVQTRTVVEALLGSRKVKG